MLPLLLVKRLSQADPERTAKESAENCNHDGVSPRAVALRAETLRPFVAVEAGHERAR